MKRFMVFCIIIYQKIISPWFPRTCRFYPTCSQYAVEALQEKKLGEALGLILRRLSRCHPFNPGGYDSLN